MVVPDDVLANWHGVIDGDFTESIRRTFQLPADDDYVYRAESFAMTLPQIQAQLENGGLKYKYQSHGKMIEVHDLQLI